VQLTRRLFFYFNLDLDLDLELGPNLRPHLSTVQVHDRTASLKTQIESYQSPYITFVPLKIQDVYDERIPGLLAGLRRESVWEPQREAHGNAGDAGLKVDLGRAGRFRVEG
jgi:hypothetical protein